MMAQPRAQSPSRRLLFTIALVLVGAGLVGFFGLRVMRTLAFKEAR